MSVILDDRVLEIFVVKLNRVNSFDRLQCQRVLNPHLAWRDQPYHLNDIVLRIALFKHRIDQVIVEIVINLQIVDVILVALQLFKDPQDLELVG